MHCSRTLTSSLVAMLVAGAFSVTSFAQTQTTIIKGTAKAEADNGRFSDYTVQAREVDKGQMTNSVPVDQDGNFLLKGLPVYKYMLELIDSQGRVVCTEGPFDVTTSLAQLDVEIDCGHIPAAFYLLGAAAAGGATAGATVDAPASASR